jgi:hypothetical protein
MTRWARTRGRWLGVLAVGTVALGGCGPLAAHAQPARPAVAATGNGAGGGGPVAVAAPTAGPASPSPVATPTPAAAPTPVDLTAASAAAAAAGADAQRVQTYASQAGTDLTTSEGDPGQ